MLNEKKGFKGKFYTSKEAIVGVMVSLEPHSTITDAGLFFLERLHYMKMLEDQSCQNLSKSRFQLFQFSPILPKSKQEVLKTFSNSIWFPKISF